MLEFIDTVNKKFKHGKDKLAQWDKMIKILIMQGTKHYSPTKKMAKVNMPTTFWTSFW